MIRWLSLVLVAGCAGGDRARLDDALRLPARPDTVAGDRYVIQCPDRIRVDLDEATRAIERTIGVDGRCEIPRIGQVRVQGKTVPEVRQAIQRALPESGTSVRVQVVEYRSQQVFVHGEVAGEDRAVPYQGPETVTEVLRRAGGLKPGAALGEVRLVRGHVADGRSPEVFDIDLQAILLQNEAATNVRVEPFDQIYIGTSRRAEFVSCLPPVARPFWEWILGIRRLQE